MYKTVSVQTKETNMSFIKKTLLSKTTVAEKNVLADRTPDWSRAIRINSQILSTMTYSLERAYIYYYIVGSDLAAKWRYTWWWEPQYTPIQLKVAGCFFMAADTVFGNDNTSRTSSEIFLTVTNTRKFSLSNGTTVDREKVCNIISGYKNSTTGFSLGVSLGCSTYLPEHIHVGNDHIYHVAGIHQLIVATVENWSNSALTPMIRPGNYLYLGDRGGGFRHVTEYTGSAQYVNTPSTDGDMLLGGTSTIVDRARELATYGHLYFVPALTSPGITFNDMLDISSTAYPGNVSWDITDVAYTDLCLV